MTARGKPEARHPVADRQRLDKWLWFARVLKTRSLAAKLVIDGHVRVNATRTDNPAKAVRVGDVVTVALDRQIRVLKIRAPGVRRGPYDEAKALFEDLSNPSEAGEDEGPEGDDEETPKP